MRKGRFRRLDDENTCMKKIEEKWRGKEMYVRKLEGSDYRYQRIMGDLEKYEGNIWR